MPEETRSWAAKTELLPKRSSYLHPLSLESQLRSQLLLFLAAAVIAVSQEPSHPSSNAHLLKK